MKFNIITIKPDLISVLSFELNANFTMDVDLGDSILKSPSAKFSSKFVLTGVYSYIVK